MPDEGPGQEAQDEFGHPPPSDDSSDPPPPPMSFNTRLRESHWRRAPDEIEADPDRA
jgi:hypothetical protein